MEVADAAFLVAGQGDAWLPERYRSPVRLIHRECGAAFHPVSVCTTCERPVLASDTVLSG